MPEGMRSERVVLDRPLPSLRVATLRSEAQDTTETAAARVRAAVRRTLCGLRGHDALLHFEDERMTLRCTSCGHESPGWELNETPPTVTVRGDARRHALVRPSLGARRMC